MINSGCSARGRTFLTFLSHLRRTFRYSNPDASRTNRKVIDQGGHCFNATVLAAKSLLSLTRSEIQVGYALLVRRMKRLKNQDLELGCALPVTLRIQTGAWRQLSPPLSAQDHVPDFLRL